jgi:predicted nucleic acid-binding protein
VREFCEDLAAFPIRVERAYVPEQWSAIISLAERHSLTVYDASYLDLSQRYGLPLATLDRDLRKAARAASVPLVEPLS